MSVHVYIYKFHVRIPNAIDTFEDKIWLASDLCIYIYMGADPWHRDLLPSYISSLPRRLQHQKIETQATAPRTSAMNYILQQFSGKNYMELRHWEKSMGR